MDQFLKDEIRRVLKRMKNRKYMDLEMEAEEMEELLEYKAKEIQKEPESLFVMAEARWRNNSNSSMNMAIEDACMVFRPNSVWEPYIPGVFPNHKKKAEKPPTIQGVFTRRSIMDKPNFVEVDKPKTLFDC